MGLVMLVNRRTDVRRCCIRYPAQHLHWFLHFLLQAIITYIREKENEWVKKRKLNDADPTVKVLLSAKKGHPLLVKGHLPVTI